MTIAIAILSISVLIVLHELGHFLTAKKFGVKVEEFGIGLPFTPALVKKRFGETEYAFYPLLIGAFVRLEGEDRNEPGPRSFSSKPIWQRVLIVAGGVLSSWIVAAAILAIVGTFWTTPIGMPDEVNIFPNARVQIAGIAPSSPAEMAGIQPGDIVLKAEGTNASVAQLTKIKQLQEFTSLHTGESVTLTLEREGEMREVTLIPRENPPKGEGAMGVALTRTGTLHFPWYEAPWQGIRLTGVLTVASVQQTFHVFGRSLEGEGPPIQEQLAGPIGITHVLSNSFALGIPFFLFFVAQIAIFLSILNTLPIPALDGGRIAFLLVEKIIGKPIPQKIFQTSIAISFMILIPLILWISINDIRRIF